MSRFVRRATKVVRQAVTTVTDPIKKAIIPDAPKPVDPQIAIQAAAKEQAAVQAQAKVEKKKEDTQVADKEAKKKTRRANVLSLKQTGARGLGGKNLNVGRKQLV
ncbi:MAG: hypothetical protein HOL31_02090 [Candidatus Scalindua sp.]|jgi:hypothetical protein|nr:hypothetical protein [Candidatus Scalindua sp.]MBT7349692.1 hypothetical protein [candidate division WWE3 bacterium]